MEGSVIVPCLLSYCLIREAIYIYTTQTLVNKIMSRNYGEYQLSKNPAKIEPTQIKQELKIIKTKNEP